jgi:hypothetical protein
MKNMSELSNEKIADMIATLGSQLDCLTLDYQRLREEVEKRKEPEPAFPPGYVPQKGDVLQRIKGEDLIIGKNYTVAGPGRFGKSVMLESGEGVTGGFSYDLHNFRFVSHPGDRPAPIVEVGQWMKHNSLPGAIRMCDSLLWAWDHWQYWWGDGQEWWEESEITPVVALQLAGETELRIGQFVEVVEGAHKGRFGILDRRVDSTRYGVVMPSRGAAEYDLILASNLRPACAIPDWAKGGVR